MKPLDVMLFMLASPILAVRVIVRITRRLRLAYLAAQQAIPCRTCGAPVSLVNFWRCRCGFTYQGHLLRFCPVCRSFPRMIRCYECGATMAVPSCD